MIWKRSSCCLHFCSWNWNWKPSSQFSWASLELKPWKLWSCQNWLWHWSLDLSLTICSRNQLHQLLVWTFPQLHHHHTIQIAGNQALLAVVHTHASGIHLHKIWPTVPTTQAAHHQAAAAAAVVAHHQLQLPQNHLPIQLSEMIAICLIYICCKCLNLNSNYFLARYMRYQEICNLFKEQFIYSSYLLQIKRKNLINFKLFGLVWHEMSLFLLI